MVGAVAALALLAACAPPARPGPQAGPPTPTPIPTAVIYADPRSRQPVWPTPPVWCPVDPVGSERPDLGPSMGGSPIWFVARPLPVLPWRGELIRSIWVVDRGASGDLALTGRQTDGPGVAQFIRQGGERATDQLVVVSAPQVGLATGSPRAERYADIPVYLVLPQPGCYELRARLGEHLRTFTLYAYN